ncbi:MAG TPA: hypothetical protein VKC53_01760 [Patescibacteria group bacterium]|nr:hypothetical protein [Patescibacteria group bacterium]
MKHFVKHLPHYLSLFGILFAGFAGLILFSYDKHFQLSIIIASAASYVAWGVVHHILHKDFHFEIFLEYLAVAILGLVIILSLIIRS